MSDLILLDPLTGQERPSWVYQAADLLIKKMKREGLWGTMDFYFQMWLKKNPSLANAYSKNKENMQATRRNKHASFENKSNRLLLQIPGEFIDFAEKYFPEQVMDIGRHKFMQMLAKRYPLFKIPEGSI